MRSSRVAGLAGLAVTLLVGVVLFAGFERPWALRGENALVMFPMAQDAWRAWLGGHAPWWTGSMWAGYPLLSGALSGAFYVPHALAFGLTPFPHWRAFDLATALHAGWLAAGSMWLLARLGVSRLAAGLGTGLALLAPQVLSWTNWLPIFAALSWWPWVLAAADRLGVERRLAPSALVVGGVALAAQVFVGYVQYALYAGLWAALWIVASRGGPSLPTRGVRVGVLAVVCLGLAAPQWIPTAIELASTTRAGGVELASALAARLDGPAALVDPAQARVGRGLGSPFLGAGALLLGVVALVARAPRAGLLAGVGLVALLLSLGDATPLYGALGALPLFELFRGPLKFLLVAQLATAWLAALGFAQLARTPTARGPVLLAALLAALALAERGTHFALQLPLAAAPHTRDEPRLPDDVAPTLGVLDALTAAGPDGVPPRVFRASLPTDFGNVGQLFGVESLRGGTTALLSSEHVSLLRREIFGKGIPRWMTREALDLYGVGLVVDPQGCGHWGARGLEPLREAEGLCLLANPDRPARYELLARARPVGDAEEAVRRTRRRPGAPVAVVATAASLEGRLAPLAPDEGVTVLRYGVGDVALETRAERDRLLLVRESWRRGWTARVDGAAASHHLAAGIFAVVEVPAGRHRVELVYRPPGIGLGFALAGATVAGLVAWTLWRRRGAPRRGDDGA